MKPNYSMRIAITVFVSTITTATVFGGVVSEDWIIFEDFVSGAECGIINTSNAELISLFDTGEMVIVSGADTILPDLIVTSDDFVLYRGEPSGQVEFVDDGDGLPAVFWTTLIGTVVEVDTFTGEPFDSGLLPEERINTGCDACDLVDNNSLCDDIGNGNGGGNGGGGNNGGDNGGDIFIPLPSICGVGSIASIVMTVFAFPFLRISRASRIR